jgi:hypothetical protein
MMKKCNEDCIPVCDFCLYYEFNADDEGAYTGDGWCSYNKKAVEPYDMCKYFYCSRLYRRENWQ